MSSTLTLDSVLRALDVDDGATVPATTDPDPPRVTADGAVVDELALGLRVELHLDGLEAVRAGYGHEFHARSVVMKRPPSWAAEKPHDRVDRHIPSDP